MHGVGVGAAAVQHFAWSQTLPEQVVLPAFGVEPDAHAKACPVAALPQLHVLATVDAWQHCVVLQAPNRQLVLQNLRFLLPPQ